jgi:hypothetical protein
VSGVFGFLVSLWFAHRGKTVTFGILAAFAVVCIAASMYLSWRDEYIEYISRPRLSIEIGNYAPFIVTADKRHWVRLRVLNTGATAIGCREILRNMTEFERRDPIIDDDEILFWPSYNDNINPVPPVEIRNERFFDITYTNGMTFNRVEMASYDFKHLYPLPLTEGVYDLSINISCKNASINGNIRIYVNRNSIMVEKI